MAAAAPEKAPASMRSTLPPIFGTAGSSSRWQWYGAMAHNSYAVLNPTNTTMSAQYRIYFGDVITGDPVAGYDDATVTLEVWDLRGAMDRILEDVLRPFT